MTPVFDKRMQNAVQMLDHLDDYVLGNFREWVVPLPPL